MGNPIADALRARADLLSQPGVWTQGTPRKGKACLLTDNTGNQKRLLTDDASLALRDFMRKREKLFITLVIWNDAPGRTVDEVCNVLRGCADSLD